MTPLLLITVLFLLKECTGTGTPIQLPLNIIRSHVEQDTMPELVDEMAKNHSFLIYHSQLCGQCRDVLELLDSKYPSLKYDYYEWQAQPGGLFLMNAVLKKTGTSVPPEIYICKEYIGGWRELAQLHNSTQLESKARSC